MDEENEVFAKIRAANKELIGGFVEWLRKGGVTKKSIDRHASDLSFFADEFLCYYDSEPLSKGYGRIESFLGDWFIRKAMWSDEKSVKGHIETFAKFHEFLRESGRIDEAEHEALSTLIRERKAIWIATVKRFNDPEVDIEDVWDFADLADHPADLRVMPDDPGTHFTIMLSGRAAKLLGVKHTKLDRIDKLADAGHWFLNWRCDFLAVHEASGAHYFLLTNARTLFSIPVEVYDLDTDSLVVEFDAVLGYLLGKLGYAMPSEFEFCYSLVRGQDRSLAGSQVQMIDHGLFKLHRTDSDLKSLVADINHMPMSAIEDVFPDRAMENALAEDPAFEPVPEGPKVDNIVPFPLGGLN